MWGTADRCSSTADRSARGRAKQLNVDAAAHLIECGHVWGKFHIVMYMALGREVRPASYQVHRPCRARDRTERDLLLLKRVTTSSPPLCEGDISYGCLPVQQMR